MLNTLAAVTSVTAPTSTGREKRSLMSEASPRPFASPRRPAVSCTAAASGHVNNAVHRKSNRNAAPTCEYVPMPEGSSSEAPVTIPGPRLRK